MARADVRACGDAPYQDFSIRSARQNICDICYILYHHNVTESARQSSVTSSRQRLRQNICEVPFTSLTYESGWPSVKYPKSYADMQTRMNTRMRAHARICMHIFMIVRHVTNFMPTSLYARYAMYAMHEL